VEDTFNDATAVGILVGEHRCDGVTATSLAESSDDADWLDDVADDVQEEL